MSQIQCYTITMNTNTEYDPLPPGLFVWMDLEYTTTDVDTARILEVAAIITNRQLEQIGEPFSLTCKPDDFSEHSMPESVVDMHTRNGLLDDVSASTYNEAALEKQALNWLKQTANDTVLIHCGYYLQCDREILARRMPALYERLGFRQLDVRCLEEMADAWTSQGRYRRTNSHNHRALGDVREAILLAGKYKERFVPKISLN